MMDGVNIDVAVVQLVELSIVIAVVDGGKSPTESVVQVRVLPEQSRGIAQLDRAADF